MDVTSSLRSLLPYGRRSIGINQLIAKLETYLPPDQVEVDPTGSDVDVRRIGTVGGDAVLGVALAELRTAHGGEH